MLKILKNTFYFLLIIFIFLINIYPIQAMTETDINYQETLDSINNPERGFYVPYGYSFKPENNVLPNQSILKKNLIHLRLGLSAFSKAVNGISDLELTEDMLNTFDYMLKTIQSNGGTAIVRFAYDDFRGTKDLEPSLDMILKHIQQLKPIFEANKDVISYVELGFFGPWGEMHSSKICTTENVSKAIDAMLESVPDNITIGVRQPKYYTSWLSIDRSLLNQNITQKGTKAYRVGLFNDGYLGSHSDLGTFQNREIEISWLENQARHTFYGGEVVKSVANETPINTIEYISKEAFRTHTTYLNSEWNDTVINSWKNSIYNGNDPLYQGKSGYLYIQNHLGYRFVLRESNIKDTSSEEKLEINLKIENVGFANLINDKVVSILLEKDNQKWEIKTNIDATKWNSEEVSVVSIKVDLPENIELGNWKVYLRISQYGDFKIDQNYQCIQLANDNIWNPEIGSNYIGTVTILKKEEKPKIDSNSNSIPVVENNVEDTLSIENQTNESSSVIEKKLSKDANLNEEQLVSNNKNNNKKISSNSFHSFSILLIFLLLIGMMIILK